MHGYGAYSAGGVSADLARLLKEADNLVKAAAGGRGGGMGDEGGLRGRVPVDSTMHGRHGVGDRANPLQGVGYRANPLQGPHAKSEVRCAPWRVARRLFESCHTSIWSSYLGSCRRVIDPGR